MTAQQIISARIIALVNDGTPVAEAFDAVLGAGAYEKMAGDLYDAIRARAA